jgi:sterol 3beta-glucosyltransferase
LLIDELTNIVIEAVRKAGVRAILSKGWSARSKEKVSDNSKENMSKENPDIVEAMNLSSAPGENCDTDSQPESSKETIAPIKPVTTNEYPSFIFPVDKIPHDWLFPLLDGVVHHGGAGSTAAGIRAGVPTAIRPCMSAVLLLF